MDVAESLWKIEPHDQNRLYALLQEILTAPTQARPETLEGLKRVGPSVVPLLRTALKNRDPETKRWRAAWLLQDFGSEAKEALPDLLDATWDYDPVVQKAALEALRSIEN